MRETARLLRDVYSIVAKLEVLHPGRSFKPDGHMVGAIGEAWASWMYGLDLLPQSQKRHDARARDGRLIQIKATQGRSIGMYARPDHLLVLQVAKDGFPSEVYNGPGKVAWDASGRMQKNGQRTMGVTRLQELMKNVKERDRLRLVNRPRRRGQVPSCV